MALKKVALFLGLFLFCCPGHAYLVTDEEVYKIPENLETEFESKQIFCQYYMGDWWGSSVYYEQSDEIIIKNCEWHFGSECQIVKIPKMAKIGGTKIYYNEKYPNNIFTNNDGNWKWKNAGCKYVNRK